MANVTPVLPGANVKAANAQAAAADGIDALFAALLQASANMQGDAAAPLNAMLPAGAELAPSGAVPMAAQMVAAAKAPAAQILQAAHHDNVQPSHGRRDAQTQPQPAIAAIIATAPDIKPDAAAIHDAGKDAPAPKAAKPDDKPKAEPAPQAAAVPAMVTLPQIAPAAKTDHDALGDATAKTAKPTAAKQVLEQSAAIRTQAETAPPAPPAPQHLEASQTPQSPAQTPATPAKFDLSPHGQNAQSGGGGGGQNNSKNPQPLRAASAPAPAPAQPQSNAPGNAAPSAPQTAPVAAIAPTPPAPVTSHIVVQPAQQNANPAPIAYDIGAMAITIAAKSQDGDHHFDIRLDPPELGSIAVHLSVNHAGQAMAHLTADKPETLQLLQNDSNNLQSALKDAGLNLAGNGLNFSLRGDQRQAGQSFPRGTARTRALSVSAVAAPTAAAAPISSYAPGALDITI